MLRLQKSIGRTTNIIHHRDVTITFLHISRDSLIQLQWILLRTLFRLYQNMGMLSIVCKYCTLMVLCFVIMLVLHIWNLQLWWGYVQLYRVSSSCKVLGSQGHSLILRFERSPVEHYCGVQDILYCWLLVQLVKQWLNTRKRVDLQSSWLVSGCQRWANIWAFQSGEKQGKLKKGANVDHKWLERISYVLGLNNWFIVSMTS